MVDGTQYRFTLEGMWQSEQALCVGMAAEMELAKGDVIVAIVPVPDSQVLAVAECS